MPPYFWDELQHFVTNDILRYVLFRKRTYLYQISVWIGHIAGTLAPRFCGWRKNGDGTIRERMLVFFIDISEGGHIECQFYSTIDPFRILKLSREHLLESVTREEDHAHVAQRHLHVGLNAVPLGSETEGLCVEIDSSLIVAGK